MKIWSGEALVEGKHYFEVISALEASDQPFEYGFEYEVSDSVVCTRELFDNLEEAKNAFSDLSLQMMYVEDFKVDGIEAASSWCMKLITDYECVNGSLHEAENSIVVDPEYYGFSELLADEQAVKRLIPEEISKIIDDCGFEIESVNADGSGYVSFDVIGTTDSGKEILHNFEFDIKGVNDLQEWRSVAAQVWCEFDRSDEVNRILEWSGDEPSSYLYDLIETDVNDYENGDFKALTDKIIQLGIEVKRGEKQADPLSKNAGIGSLASSVTSWNEAAGYTEEKDENHRSDTGLGL